MREKWANFNASSIFFILKNRPTTSHQKIYQFIARLSSHTPPILNWKWQQIPSFVHNRFQTFFSICIKQKWMKKIFIDWKLDNFYKCNTKKKTRKETLLEKWTTNLYWLDFFKVCIHERKCVKNWSKNFVKTVTSISNFKRTREEHKLYAIITRRVKSWAWLAITRKVFEKECEQ